jgi:hypothetical protein
MRHILVSIVREKFRGDFVELILRKSNNEKLKDGFIELLEPYEFHWWGTLEFDPKKPMKDAMRAKKYFTNYVKSNLNLPGQAWPSYFMSVEHFKDNYFTHIHFMLAGLCQELSANEAGKIIGAPWWEKYHGYCYLEKFNPKMGAAGYVAKYVTKALCDWDVNLKPEHRKDYLLFKK